MTNDEKELIRDLINQSSTKVQLLQKTIIEKDAEIEQLKAENEQLRKLGILGYEATVEFHDDIVSEPSADCKEKEIKQAKLNILGEMWARISHNKTLIQSHIADGSFTIEDIYMEIDELMAEVQNET